ncbi:MAG: SO_0444 family Cu/Zn efflux transporter [Spirochaetia bacterium]|jgi:uncharacterized membrane protein YraQ (UPF0718 family)|nr:SO_0444 family Cu/Zn efflux transporter [Spirochaetia bacterium]
MFDIIYGILKETFFLFIDMSPYIILGMVLAGILSVLISRETVSRHIGSHTFSSILKASLFGVPLPLCSCGVIPAAVYIKRAGASHSAAMAFLISTPQTGIDSVIATYGLMGPFFAVFRPVSALLTGVWGGLLSLFLDRDGRADAGAGTDAAAEAAGKDAESDAAANTAAIEPGCCSTGSSCCASPVRPTGIRDKLKKIYDFVFIEFMDDIALQFVIGIIIAGFISYIIPDNFFQDTLFSGGISGMILMILIGIPIYVCSTTSIPIALALLAKGISPGAAYVFLIAGPATNAASLSILLKVLGKKQTIIYLVSIISGSLVSGAVIDLLASFPWMTDIVLNIKSEAPENSVIIDVLLYAAALFFFFLLTSAFLRKIKQGKHKHVHG